MEASILSSELERRLIDWLNHHPDELSSTNEEIVDRYLVLLRELMDVEVEPSVRGELLLFLVKHR